MNRKPNKKIFRKILINNQVIIINIEYNKNSANEIDKLKSRNNKII